MTKKHKNKLDAYEQEIEDNLEFAKPVKNENELIEKMQKAAEKHLNNKKPITIRVSPQDLEAIKVKAAKCGLPYQTYLNMLIHKDATSL